MPLNKLNTEQLSAVNAPFGHNLIIASAGTGKTSTIVGRIAKLLNDGVNPREILLLTFTNKAANEMISRLERHFDSAITKQINAGTFHASAYRYLKEHSHITLKQPRELKTLLKSIVNVRRFDESVAHYKAEYLYDLMSLYVNTNGNLSLDFGNSFLGNHSADSKNLNTESATPNKQSKDLQCGFAQFSRETSIVDSAFHAKNAEFVKFIDSKSPPSLARGDYFDSPSPAPP